MKILLIVPAFVPAYDYGGPVSKVNELGTELTRLGHDVEVWASNFGLGRHRIRAGQTHVDGLPVRYFRRQFTYRWSAVSSGVYLAARRSRADIAHCFGVRDGLTLLAAAGLRAARIPYIVEPLGMQAANADGRNSRLKSLYDRSVGRRYLSDAAGLVITSLHEAQALTTEGARTWLRANPVAHPNLGRPSQDIRRRLGIPSNRFVVGWIGRVSRTKALPVLVDAMSSVDDADLILCGPDDRDGAGAELATSLNRSSASDRIHRIPALWNDEKASLWAAADTIVLPSHTESFGNAAAEAACAGIPVVVSDQCGVAPMIVGSGAGLVTEVSAEGIADALCRLRDSTELRTRCSQGGARLRQQLSPASIAREQYEIYLEVLRTST